MSDRDWRIFKENFDIQTKNGAPQPIRNWNELIISPQIMMNIDLLGYEKPTPI